MACGLLSLSLTASVGAQAPCTSFIIDDGLAPASASLCCNTVVPPPLPPFPPITTTGTWYTRTSCAAPVSANVTVVVEAPILQTCGTYLIKITVTPAGGAGPTFSGKLQATYASTWVEQRNTPFFAGQIWRFLISGDVTWESSVFPTPDPPCHPSFDNLVHLVGSIDYACGDDGAGNPNWYMRYNLHHLCDCFQHSSRTPRPAPDGGFHPSIDYNLVGPNPVTINPTPISFPDPCSTASPPAQYLNGSIRELNPISNVCYLETLLFASAGGGTAPMSLIESCNAGTPICACTGAAGSFWQLSNWTFRYVCNTASATVSIPASNPCTSNHGAVQMFAARHPASGVVFPADRDVFFWFLRGDLSTMQGGLCQSSTVSDEEETLTGVTTAYTGTTFSAFDWNPVSAPLSFRSDISQSDWMNHHLLEGNTPVYGVPTVGTLILSGLN